MTEADEPKSPSTFGEVAGDAVVRAAEAVDIAAAAARQAGLVGKNGKVSKFRVAKAALRPGSTAQGLLAGAAAEIKRKRDGK
ncbi:hypothetical protein ACFXHA_26335 [Nocardia sp. NPDC059240]|uniref:hypothetical protein n=1 Tax=Nocardia sp. NPDC059240 TaxID=3346786 RepID=UPI0036C9F8A2